MLSTQLLQEDMSGCGDEGRKYDVAKLILFAVLLLHMIFHCPFRRSFVNFLTMKKHALCPYREARYWKCARRRQRRASNKESTDSDCARLRRCRRQLPPPLPYRKRARPKEIPLTPEELVLQDEIKTAEKKQIVVDKPSSSNEVVDSRLDIQPSKMYRTRSLSVRLIDMVRMQQWQAILDRPIKRKDAKFRDADGLYCLHWAAAGGAPTRVLQSLIDCYPSAIRKTDNEGSLPLHFAAHYAAGLNTVELLLRSYPAAVRIQDKYGRTPTYHAAEKSAKLEVLKLLVNEDPGTVTTPCYAVSNKTTRRYSARFDKKDLSSMTRSQAILTPLYLVWHDIVFDHNARTPHTGKKWEKAVWMLQQAYQRHTSRKDDSPLLACITMDIFLPEQVISLIVKAYPELLRVPDPIHGNLPLATAAIACHSTPKSLAYRRQVILETLLGAYMPAVEHRNRHGRSVLWEAAATGRVSWSILERILKHAPDALEWHDRETQLPLALYAAASSAPAIYPLPHQCMLGSHEQVLPSDSRIRDFLDPFHLLTDKQYDLLLKEHEKNQKLDVSVHETTADHHHLNVIYEFLKANPSQIILRS